MTPRVPRRQLTFPGGWTIQVVYRTDKQIRKVAGEACFGYWQGKGAMGGRIVLNKETPSWRQLRTFGHELVHAVHDYAHWLEMHADDAKETEDKLQWEQEEEEKC